MLSQQVRTVRGFEAGGDERWNLSVCTLHVRLVRQPSPSPSPSPSVSDSSDTELTTPQLGPTSTPRWRFQSASACAINARPSAPQLERPDNLRVLVSIERGLVGIRERHVAAGPLLWQHQVHCLLCTLYCTVYYVNLLCQQLFTFTYNDACSSTRRLATYGW